MNTYKITFTRENGTVGSDNFTAPSEAQAWTEVLTRVNTAKGRA